MSGRLKTVSLALVLFLLNAYICRGLFSVEYLQYMGSNEGAYIGISRYAMTHWRDLRWFPLWYDGIPYQNTYPPLLHWGVALVALVRGISAAHAHHWVTALAYCLGPVTLYALVLRMCGSRWTAFAAGAIYSVVSWSAWLVPAIARDLGSPWYPRRLQALVYYGDGPHVAALTLLPLALLLLDLAVSRRRVWYVAFAALGLAAVALTNWLGAFALALTILSYLLARLGSGKWSWRDLAWTAAAVAAAYCLAMPWIPPSTILVTQFNARNVGGDYTQVYKHLPQWGAGILLELAILKAAVRRLQVPLQFTIFFAFLFSLLTLVHSWWNISIVPQGNRYHLEMDMALSLLVALTAQAVLKRRPRWVAGVAAGLLVLALIQPARICRRYAHDTLIRTIDIASTTEWKTAQWLNEHWSGERVMMPGSTSIWLAAFSDTPQLAGGFDQGVTDYTIRVAIYEIYSGAAAGAHDGEFSLLWLKALGVQAVGAGGPRSGEYYKPFQNPKKFEGLLEPIWRDGDDTTYRVGQPHATLARVIPRASAVARAPVNGIDVDPLRPYVAALDDPEMPRADFHWTSGHSARIATTLRPDRLVSVQIAWHPGWRAVLNGRPVAVKRDLLGLMAIDPGVAGECIIDLIYDGGTEMRIARWLSALSALTLLGLAARGLLKRP
jgi:hypothetical protein